MKKILVGLFVAILLLAGVLLVQTFRFAPETVTVKPLPPIALDEAVAAQRLANTLKFQTLSTQNPSNFNGEPFLAMHKYLEEAFPRAHSVLKKEVVNSYSLLYEWPGRDAGLKPLLFLAHQDVVPAAEDTLDDWPHPPFDGIVADGYIWGRGAMDDKCSLAGLLVAVETLAAEGFQPERTVYFAFGHDEEVSGMHGAKKLAELLESRGIQCEFVLDEGGGVVTGLVPGLDVPAAVIGVGEKGYLTLELSVTTEGGHSSTPPKQTAVGILSRAITRLEDRPLPANMTHATRFLGAIGPKMSFGYRLVFANQWLFGPVIERVLAGIPDTNAVVRTTTAATMFNAGVKENVLPTHARAVVNFRLLPGDTIDRVIEYVTRVIDDDRVKVESLPDPSEASPISNTDSESYRMLRETVFQVFQNPNMVVAPFLTLGATDARHYAKVADNTFRFLGLDVTKADLKRIHGAAERISTRNYVQIVQLYRQIMLNSASK